MWTGTSIRAKIISRFWVHPFWKWVPCTTRSKTSFHYVYDLCVLIVCVRALIMANYNAVKIWRANNKNINPLLKKKHPKSKENEIKSKSNVKKRQNIRNIWIKRKKKYFFHIIWLVPFYHSNVIRSVRKLENW